MTSCPAGLGRWCVRQTRTRADWRSDVIVIVDTSPSMAEEVPRVEAALNRFVSRTCGIDLRVKLIAARPGPGLTSPSIRVPAPLGSGSCPPQGDDTALPRLFHDPTAVLNQERDLPSALGVSALYDLGLRANAKWAVVVVSDGDGPSDSVGGLLSGLHPHVA